MQVGNAADVVEIGVPFTDPMADGMTIQRSSREALRQERDIALGLEELGAMQKAGLLPRRRCCS
jgi:tryptophan synthase alpha chain